MGREGGEKFEAEDRGSPEAGREVVVGGNATSGDLVRPAEATAGRELEPSSWLAEFINPEILERMRRSLWGQEHSDEFLIYDRLLGVLVEQAPEWDAQATARLRSFVNAFRIVAYPVMKPGERAHIRGNAKAFPDVLAGQTIDVDAVRGDIQWTWRAFGLRVPSAEAAGIAGHLGAGFYTQLGLTRGK